MVEFPIGGESSSGRTDVSISSAYHWILDRFQTAPKSFWGICLIAGMLACVLPYVYDIVIRATVEAKNYQLKHSIHIALNVALNIVCVVSLLVVRGHFRHRLEAAIVGVLVNFALLLFALMAFRLYYSRPVLIVSFLASIVLVTLLSLVLEKYRESRIGIIPQGIDEDMRQKLGSMSEFVATPTSNARNYDTILVNWSQLSEPQWRGFAENAILSGCEVRHVASFIETNYGRVLPEYFEQEHASILRNSVYLNIYKRALDILLVLLALPIALFILAIASLLILVTMGRPILFVQDRLGINGKTFRMYKLRSMKIPSTNSIASATVVGDKRVTPLGQFLRRFRIDEIPQFYNILVGDMSLVGPRPEQPELAKDYVDKMPAFQCRTMLRPGITGWAQVRGSYAADDKETENKLTYDLYYLKYVSFTTDLSILFQTVKTLATGNSAR